VHRLGRDPALVVGSGAEDQDLGRDADQRTPSTRSRPRHARLTPGSNPGRSGVAGRIGLRRRRTLLVDWRMPGDLPRSLIQLAESVEDGEQAGPLVTPETAALTPAEP